MSDAKKLDEKKRPQGLRIGIGTLQANKDGKGVSVKLIGKYYVNGS